VAAATTTSVLATPTLAAAGSNSSLENKPSLISAAGAVPAPMFAAAMPEPAMTDVEAPAAMLPPAAIVPAAAPATPGVAAPSPTAPELVAVPSDVTEPPSDVAALLPLVTAAPVNARPAASSRARTRASASALGKSAWSAAKNGSRSGFGVFIGLSVL
jgi:hypothetical protein